MLLFAAVLPLMAFAEDAPQAEPRKALSEAALKNALQEQTLETEVLKLKFEIQQLKFKIEMLKDQEEVWRKYAEEEYEGKVRIAKTMAEVANKTKLPADVLAFEKQADWALAKFPFEKRVRKADADARARTTLEERINLTGAQIEDFQLKAIEVAQRQYDQERKRIRGFLDESLRGK